MQHAGGTKRDAADADEGTAPSEWPAGFAVMQQHGSSELVLQSQHDTHANSAGVSGARLLSFSETWDDFFLSLASAGTVVGGAGSANASPGSVFEWYELTCADLWPFIGSFLRPGFKLLHIGCGTSTLGSDAYDRVLKEHGDPLAEVANVDLSAPAIDALAAQGAHLSRPGLHNMVMDATQMSFAAGAWSLSPRMKGDAPLAPHTHRRSRPLVPRLRRSLRGVRG